MGRPVKRPEDYLLEILHEGGTLDDALYRAGWDHIELQVQLKHNPVLANKVHIATGLNAKQIKFIRAFSKRRCHIGNTCVAAGISRTTFNLWISENEAFARAVTHKQEALFDDVEDTIVDKALVDRDSRMLEFYAKSKMGDRGFNPKQVHEVKNTTTFHQAQVNSLDEAALDAEIEVLESKMKKK